jgi:hypothetical protein
MIHGDEINLNLNKFVYLYYDMFYIILFSPMDLWDENKLHSTVLYPNAKKGP